MFGTRHRTGGAQVAPADPHEPGAKRDRLDPVRWRRPGRGTLIRTGVVAALLSTAATVAWSRPIGCPPTTTDAVQTEAAAARAQAEATHHDPTAHGQVPGSAAGSAAGDTGSGTAPARPRVPAGKVGVPVRLAEPGVLPMLHPGDRVDVVGVAADGKAPTPVADDALVLGLTETGDPTVAALLLAMNRAEAARTVGATDRTRFAVLLRSASRP